MCLLHKFNSWLAYIHAVVTRSSSSSNTMISYCYKLGKQAYGPHLLMRSLGTCADLNARIIVCKDAHVIYENSVHGRSQRMTQRVLLTAVAKTDCC